MERSQRLERHSATTVDLIKQEFWKWSKTRIKMSQFNEHKCSRINLMHDSLLQIRSWRVAQCQQI